jgi:NAD(P)-dependent dehydrogenase (short-subunit alcohol dehydrogenase family)
VGLLDGQVAIVTGSGRGIGRGEAIALAREGAKVTVLSRTLADVEKVAEEIDMLGGTAVATRCDVSNRTQVDDAVRMTIEAFGRIDILVNNAQVIPQPHPLETWTEEEARLMLESGYIGTWNFIQACFPQMKAQRHGRIINTCSASGYGNVGGWSGYGAAKEAIRSLSRSAAMEWGEHGITVNMISPAVMSPLVEAHYPDEASRQALLAQFGVAMRRFGDAEADVGRTVVFLAGPDASYITGCTVCVDGGTQMLV